MIEAETHGIEHYPLYRWTKETIENPVTSKKPLGVFTLHVEGEETYPKKVADALEHDLSSSTDGTPIKRIAKYDTNPANNPEQLALVGNPVAGTPSTSGDGTVAVDRSTNLKYANILDYEQKLVN